MMQAVLWDLDGTVLDSKPGVFHSVHYALERLHLPIPNDTTLNAFLGPPISDGFQTVCGVSKELTDRAITLYREYYNSGGKFEASLYDGVEETLRRFRKYGIRNFVTTSKPRIFAEQILEHFDALKLFDGVYGSELDGTRGHKAEVLAYCIDRESLNRDEIVLIGDRHFDVDGAKQIGIPCIGVLYGYGSREELETAGASYTVFNCKELDQYILNA